MKGICPNCERETSLRTFTTTEELEIRGDEFAITHNLVICPECENAFEDPASQVDPVDAAYREYRMRHGFLQPEEIRSFRKSVGLTQRELSTLLGWGGATLSRYENGALQSEAHEKLLRLAMEPRNLLSLIDASPHALSPSAAKRITSDLRAIVSPYPLSLKSLCQEHIANYEPDEYSGYKRLDLDKLTSAVLFFASGPGIFKTKLNKLLFYADFKHFKEYTVPITGARYAHLPYGPAPDHYELILAALVDGDNTVAVEERDFSDYVGEVLVATQSPFTSLFSHTELSVLGYVSQRFSRLTAKQVGELSHKEAAYLSTGDGELISYAYADALSI